ncbi:MAG: sigma-54 dependent transcriptional regulator [Desulfovibrio sp.]|nr:sigma-54 dependent transcriptional regulator [Desulfovibrio sp.]
MTIPRILVVDDDLGHLESLALLLKGWGYAVTPATRGEEAAALVEQGPYDAVLMDVRMPGLSGVEALARIKQRNPAVPVLIMTAYSTVDVAVEALKAGAYDYLTKPLDFELVRLALDRALDHTRLKKENASLRARLPDAFDPGCIIGVSPALQEALAMAAVAARSEATALVTGESGTGKELIARAVHANSARARRPLVPLNCAALTASLLESELFGHEKGAFTGADKRREGRILQADGGTLFLDEIGELDALIQAKLLRVLQQGELQRLGSDDVLTVDVRIIAATNRDLEAEVAAGRFRQDLFYRLNVLHIHVPALRERPEDIPLLAQHFLDTFAAKYGKSLKRFTPQAMDALVRHGWPGNVRELENAIERAALLAAGEYVSERELPLALRQAAAAPLPLQAGADTTPAPPSLAGRTLEDVEKAAILQTLAQTGGNKSEAARLLGISRVTLHKKLQGYGVE